MNYKNNRLSAIRVIVASGEIDSQEELLSRLRALGFDLTQSTLSRDLKALDVVKTMTPNGTSVYALPDSVERFSSDAKRSLRVRDTFVSINFSGNMAVIKTRPGYAAGMAYDIDQNQLVSILGTVAGHDTILLVVKEGYTKKEVMLQLGRIIPEIYALDIL